MQTNDTTTPGAPFGPSEGNNREATSDIRNEGAELLSALFRDAPDDQLSSITFHAPLACVLGISDGGVDLLYFH